MNRQEYINQYGEDPVDMFGPDWENIVDEYDRKEAEATGN